FSSDLCMEEELVFIDNLENFRKSLPTSSLLLSRLHFFFVKDPLLDSEGRNVKEENIFRECLTFQNEMKMEEGKKELPEIKEKFCTISVKDEEVSSCCFLLNIILVIALCYALMFVNLQVVLLNSFHTCQIFVAFIFPRLENTDLKAEITYQIEISKYCPIPQDICSSNNRSILEFCESGTMEVPLTPPCRQQRSWVNCLCTRLEEEPIPVSGSSILITEASREYLESFVWQSEKYQDNMNSFLLTVKLEYWHRSLEYWHRSLTELKEMLSAEVEAPMLSSLEEGWWRHLGLNPVSIETVEQINMDATNANSLLPTELETFTQFTSCQLESKHQLDKVINLSGSPRPQRQYFALPMSAALSAKIHSTNTSVEELNGGNIKKNKVEETIYFSKKEKKNPKSSESLSCKDVSSKQDSSSSSQKPASFAVATKWDNDDSDLNNFIMLRSNHALTQREEKDDVDSPENEQHMCVHKEDSSVSETVRIKEKEQQNEDSVTINIEASESQCQAYCLLEEVATPVLKDLTHLGVLASVNWNFDSIKFDHTRFFLKQQEKVVCDCFKEGKIDEKEIMLFRHAALVHLLVTVRDLLLTCGLDTALGYLSKAKDIYKNVLESCLNNIWRQLKIVQYSSQKKQETNPKITELRCQMLKWMQSYGEEHSVKILIITRMDSEREKAALIHILSRVEGTKLTFIHNFEMKNECYVFCCALLHSCLYSCVIVPNQQIGADFPWTHFSLVMEYDYSENSCWKGVCKNLNVTYMTFKTTLPETILTGNHCGSFLLEVQIPYVFLTTEGILNMPDILQLLESKYSITFVERSSSYSLRLFGSTRQYVVLTVDECTAIFLQSMEELNYEKSCDNVILKLMALSLQYTCCWLVFYSRERLSLEYSLRGDTLLNLVLIYATLIEFTQKSDDFEVKVVLMPGIEETALVIRQIADNILITSSISPHEWLDKSWISVLPSETEKCLVTFPCINALVAQLMLKKGSSLNRLFLASFDQLQELLPEVPKKVLKHFSDITSSYSPSTAAPLETSVKDASPPEKLNRFNTF
ncbi:SHOC1 protein, partial [Podilymbus podiceps]|nr:SHOC1 protein [Podilymbus podiceps]